MSGGPDGVEFATTVVVVLADGAEGMLELVFGSSGRGLADLVADERVEGLREFAGRVVVAVGGVPAGQRTRSL